jgi:hypothetical protein
MNITYSEYVFIGLGIRHAMYMRRIVTCGLPHCILQRVKLKSESYFNMSNLFTKIYKMLYYTTNLYLQ